MATGRGAHSCAGVRSRPDNLYSGTYRSVRICKISLCVIHIFYIILYHYMLTSVLFFVSQDILITHLLILIMYRTTLIPYVFKVSAYCVGNLNMPENPLPWETVGQEYASNLATPAAIMVDASNGASDYGKKTLFHCLYTFLTLLSRKTSLMNSIT